MPVNNRELVALAAEVSRIRGLKVSIKESLKGGILAGLATVVGGILMGPIGLAVGGTVGGITAAAISNDFRPLYDVIMNDLTPAQQARLVNRVHKIIQDIRVEDAALLLPLVIDNERVFTALVSTVMDFVTNDLSIQVVG